jgi:Lrp/AsnC family transcriptional regulator for asnA, asnC and gidA
MAGRAKDTRLDALDATIIQMLQEDGTLSYRRLAAACNCSEATIRRRIRVLRENDVVRIVAVVDPFKQGYPVVAIINMQIDQRQMRLVKESLARMEQLRFVGVTVGAFDVVAEAWFKSSEEMLRFTSDVLAQVPGVIRVEPLQIHEMVTYAYDWGKSTRRDTERDGRVLAGTGTATVVRRRAGTGEAPRKETAKGGVRRRLPVGRE